MGNSWLELMFPGARGTSVRTPITAASPFDATAQNGEIPYLLIMAWLNSVLETIFARQLKHWWNEFVYKLHICIENSIRMVDYQLKSVRNSFFLQFSKFLN
jgi:hypothetical protein